MLGAPVSKEYCLEKCIVADQLKKILGKTEVIHLFPVRKQNTISPKNEHLRTPPRNEQDRGHSLNAEKPAFAFSVNIFAFFYITSKFKIESSRRQSLGDWVGMHWSQQEKRG